MGGYRRTMQANGLPWTKEIVVVVHRWFLA